MRFKKVLFNALVVSLCISEFGSKWINLYLNLFVDDYLSIESDFIFMDSNAISSPLGCFTVWKY